MKRVTVTLLTSLLATAGAEGKTPPPAGAYTCLQLHVMLTNQVQFNPYSPNANGLGFAIDLAPMPVPIPSPLGGFTLDGKGKYVHTDMNGKEVGRGTYTFDKTTGRVMLTGSLAEVKNLKLNAFKGAAKDPTFQFVFDKTVPIECSLDAQAKAKLNASASAPGATKPPAATTQTPTTQASTTQTQATRQTGNVPNPQVNGVLTITAYDNVVDVDARTGKVLWSSRGGGLQRLPGGLMAYGLSGQLVIAKAKGEVLTRINGLDWSDTLGLNFLLTLSPDGTRVLVAPLEEYNQGLLRPNWRLLSTSGQVLARRDASEGSYYLTAPRDLPAFLPDGRLLIPNPEDKLLYVYDGQLRKRGLFVDEPSTLPVVSPDGKQVAMLRGSQVVVTDSGGRELKRLPVLSDYRITNLAFSPDSRHLGFLAIAGTWDYMREAGYIDLNTGRMHPLSDAGGETVTVKGGVSQSYRLSWWTGQPALPTAWKNGVPQSSAPAPSAPTSNAPAPGTVASPSTPAPAALARAEASDSSATPWPAWLPQAKFDFGQLHGTLNLVLPVQQGEQRGISGAAKVNGQDMLAAFFVQGGLRMLAVQQADKTVRACLIARESASTLSGMVFNAPNFETTPTPTGEECSVTKR